MTNLRMIIGFAAAAAAAIAASEGPKAQYLRADDDKRMLVGDAADAAFLETFSLIRSYFDSIDGSGMDNDGEVDDGLGMDDDGSGVEFNDRPGKDDFSRDLDKLNDLFRDSPIVKDLTASSSKAPRLRAWNASSGLVDMPITTISNGSDALNITTFEVPMTNVPMTDIAHTATSDLTGFPSPNYPSALNHVADTPSAEPNGIQTATSGSIADFVSAAPTFISDASDWTSKEAPTKTDASTLITTQVPATDPPTLVTTHMTFTGASGLVASTVDFNVSDTISKVNTDQSSSTIMEVLSTDAPILPPTATVDYPKSIPITMTSLSGAFDIKIPPIALVSSSIGAPSTEGPTTSDDLTDLKPDVDETYSPASKASGGWPTIKAPIWATDAPQSGVPAPHGIGYPIGISDSAALKSFLTSGNEMRVEAWNQCGGSGFDFSKLLFEKSFANSLTKLPCTAGYTCNEVNAWYFQCQPVVITGPATVEVWNQCGGSNHVGSTACTTGSVCKYINKLFSQCVPANI